MKSKLSLLLILLTSTFVVKSQNLFDVIDSLYQNDTTFTVADSLKTGYAKDLDRLQYIWHDRLFPHGDIGEAASAMKG